MKRLLLILIITHLSIIGFGQTNSIDSLISSLSGLKVDSSIYKTYVRIADAYADSSYDKSISYFNKALDLAEKSKVRKRVAHVYHKIGSLYLKKGEFPAALENFNNALAIHTFLNNKTGIGQLLNDIGLIYKTWGKYDKALENYLKALNLFDEIGDEINGAMASNNIGQIYYYQSDFNKAIEYFKKYLDVNKKNKTYRAVAGAANNIASAYMELNKLDDALNYYIRSMRTYDSLGIKVGVAIIKDNIGSLYLRKKQFNDALLYNSEASKIFEEIGSQSRLCASLQSVGLAYTKLKQPELAVKFLTRSLDIAMRLKQQETKKDVYESLSEVYTQTKQFDKALLNYKLFVEIKDSLLNSEAIGKIENIQAEYESQKKEKDLVEINQKLHSQKVLGLVSGVVILLFLFLTALIIRENRQKKKSIRIAEEETKNLYHIVGKTNRNLVLSLTEKLRCSSVFENFWHINSDKDDISSFIPFFKDSYLLIAFISKGNTSCNQDIIKLSIYDFFNSLNGSNFNSSIKEQFSNFVSTDVTWKKILSNEKLVNVDFWCYNEDAAQQQYSGIINAFYIDNSKQIIDLRKKTNTWLKVEKGDRLYFCTSKSLNSFIMNEQEFIQTNLSKTISKSLDLTFDEQKEILSNSLELIEAGNDHNSSISIIGFMF